MDDVDGMDAVDVVIEIGLGLPKWLKCSSLPTFCSIHYDKNFICASPADL
jgi:hypothetical protein